MTNIKKISLKSLSLQQTDGSYLTIHPVNIIDRSNLFDLLQEIQNFIDKLPPEYKEGLSFQDIWDSDPYFVHMCCEAIRYAGVDPSTLDIHTIYSLLMPYYDEESKEIQSQGALVSLNFSPKVLAVDKTEENTKDAMDNQQTLAEIIGGLWTTTESISEALELVDKLPADELISVLQYRNKIISDAQEKAERSSNPQSRTGKSNLSAEGRKNLREEYKQRQKDRIKRATQGGLKGVPKEFL